MGFVHETVARALGLPPAFWLNAVVLAASVATAWLRLFIWAGRPESLDEAARAAPRLRSRPR